MLSGEELAKIVRDERAKKWGARKGALMGLTVYHVTTEENAEAIIRDGFTQREHKGVWVSDVRLTDAPGNTTLEVTLSVEEKALAAFEWIEEGKGYREWLVPARLLNPWIAAISSEKDDPDEGWRE